MITEKEKFLWTKQAEGFLSSIQLAKTFERRHDQVTNLIKQYQKKFETFGVIESSIAKTGGRPTVEYFLNEKHLAYLITLLGNVGEIPESKRRLVNKFFEYADKQASRRHEGKNILQRHLPGHQEKSPGFRRT